jgi:hypothetical protein
MKGYEQQTSNRKVDEHKNWVEIVIKISEQAYIPVFNDAWQEFLLAKEATDA